MIPTRTKRMDADDIAAAFNGSVERSFWRAVVGGTRVSPTVLFNSRSSMVALCLHMTDGRYSAKFSRVHCSFGDFMASIHRSLVQVQTALKASGMPVAVPLRPEGVLRCEYDAETKEVSIHLARTGDDWLEVEPMAFKVPDAES